MEEVLIKSHLIVTDVHDEYSFDWCGRIMDAEPELKNGMPIFIIIGTKGRMELNTANIDQIEKGAKLMTQPKGRSAVATDKSRIFIKEKNGKEKLLGILTHNHIKTFAPMYDKVGYR